MKRGSPILAYTTTYGSRPFLPKLVRKMRSSAGTWMDWLVCVGSPSEELEAAATQLLHQEDREGIQHLIIWPENRGSHHGTAAALAFAREHGYEWLLRLDDDLQPRTRRWLKKMIERLDVLKELPGDGFYRLIASPRILGLKNPIETVGTIQKGQDFPVEIVEVLGGACRLHPVELLSGYEAPLYDPIGRGDPESIATYLNNALAFQVRFPDLKMVHQTRQLEAMDTPEQAWQRKVSKVWPWLGEGV